jgi:hypothetical protein
MQVVGVTGVNDSYMAAGESVLMCVLWMPGVFAHRDPPGCKGIEFDNTHAPLREQSPSQ